MSETFLDGRLTLHPDGGMMSYVYIVSEGPEGPVKIGRSASPLARFSTLKTGNPRPLKLVATFKLESHHAALQLERDAHLFLTGARIGGEWFDFEERDAIAAVTACLPDEAHA